MNGDKAPLTLYRPGTLTAECIEDCLIGYRFGIGALTVPFWIVALILGMHLMDGRG